MFNFNNGPGSEGKCNCTWMILLILFIVFCGCGKCGDKQFTLCINPCSLAPILALAFCCGGIGISKGC